MSTQTANRSRGGSYHVCHARQRQAADLRRRRPPAPAPVPPESRCPAIRMAGATRTASWTTTSTWSSRSETAACRPECASSTALSRGCANQHRGSTGPPLREAILVGAARDRPATSSRPAGTPFSTPAAPVSVTGRTPIRGVATGPPRASTLPPSLLAVGERAGASSRHGAVTARHAYRRFVREGLVRCQAP